MRTWAGIAAMGLLLSAPRAFAKGDTATVGGGHMQHCPTAVAGAKVEITDTKDAVDILVTGSSAAQVEEIRKRAKHVVEAAKADPASVAHTGDGHGGGGLGRCEVVLKDTTVATVDIDGGAKITVKPVKPVDLDWLKKETRSRQVANAGTAKKKAN